MMEKMKKLIPAVAAALLFQVGAGAQNWQQVHKLYHAGMYSEAVHLVGNAQGQDADAYRALCALGMRADNAQSLALAFVGRNGEHVLAPQVRFGLGQLLFDKGAYEEALKQFEQCKGLYPDQEAERLYKMGFSAYSTGEWDFASTFLAKVKGQPYEAPAQYTLGYMDYARRYFKDAIGHLKVASKDPRFASLAQYYILECRFNLEDYDYVVEHGEEIYTIAPDDRKPHLARILGESHLILGNVEEAGKYYSLDRNDAPTRSDRFYAGEINYLQQNWSEAVNQFTQMGERKDSLGQIASYQLAYSYIRLKNKVAAMTAFKEAADLSYSATIQEDAYYNYAKLAFDLGRDTAPFQEYLNRYGTVKGDQIYSYMAMAALQNHDYEGAVDAYDHIDELDPRQKSNYMKAYFLRARQLMEAGSWRGAVQPLKAAAYYSDRKDGFNQISRYYLAEAFYRDGKYADARAILTELYNLSALPYRPEGGLIPYQLAYTYFKEADYEHALRWFNVYVEARKPLQGADALTRIGDCYFFRGDYATAVKAYENQMAEYPDAQNLYPRLRAGVACGLLGDNAKKVHLLVPASTASPDAPYYGEALYELGRGYVALKKEDAAVRTFSTLRSTTRDSSLVAHSLLELGMIARNAGRAEDALDCYKEVVAQGGEYAEDALLAIEAIYRTQKDPDAYLAYVNSLGQAANRTEAQKEEVYFSSAEQLYLAEDYAKAQTTLLTYLEKYPQALYGAKARFYLAECYRFNGNKELACDAYEQALNEGLEGALAEGATLQLASLNYALGNYADAYRAYLRLKGSAQMDQNRKAAAIGLMRSSFRAREWADAIADSRLVLDSFKADKDLQREARYVNAKSLMSTSRRAEALEQFKLLAKEPATDEGAEAAYILIQDRFDRADFAAVQSQVYAFADKAGNQSYWLAKAFIVLGDTFAEQDNMSQARATFESIKSGYTSTGDQDDVLDQVEMRLKKL